MLHYTDDPPCQAGFQSRPELELVSQPCFAAQYRSMSEVECRSMSGGYGWSTEEWSRSTVEGECRWTNM
ncbi:hypothetical protein F2Q68_00014871 [Brassica cretica]|uniref:Uncharacterized protein n=1 Tax=Brassica cretica TaxID=69181 RepID=A0A8S9HPV9_BRACR|nr:hypothetical protein F2Q68_00014871 [Brassica cretica]